MYWESSYWFLTLDSEFLEETLYEQQKQLNSAISSYSWDLQTIVRPLRKAIVFAVDEMNVAHDLFQGCYASPTLLETISRGLHDLNFDQEWPLQSVPEGTFNGRLKGTVIDADIDASVALKLGGCTLKGPSMERMSTGQTPMRSSRATSRERSLVTSMASCMGKYQRTARACSSMATSKLPTAA